MEKKSAMFVQVTRALVKGDLIGVETREGLGTKTMNYYCATSTFSGNGVKINASIT
jgi:hypothetical protein